jgi:hypothetical protein
LAGEHIELLLLFPCLSALKRADQFGHEASSSESGKEVEAEEGCGHA